MIKILLLYICIVINNCYSHPVIWKNGIVSNVKFSNQIAELKNIDKFETEFSDARTFCFLHELELLSKNGLIKGGDLNNAIVYVDQEVDENELKRLAKLFDKKSIKISKDS